MTDVAIDPSYIALLIAGGGLLASLIGSWAITRYRAAESETKGDRALTEIADYTSRRSGRRQGREGAG